MSPTPEEQANIDQANAQSLEQLGRPLRPIEITIAARYPRMAVGTYERWYGDGAEDHMRYEDALDKHLKMAAKIAAMQGKPTWERLCKEHIAWLGRNISHLRGPSIDTFRAYAVALEKSGRHVEALEITCMAVALGVRNPAEKDPAKRIARLEKKLGR